MAIDPVLIQTPTTENDTAQEGYIMYFEKKCGELSAQLVVQDIWGAKIQVQLQNQKKKKADKSMLADGGNLNMTSDHWVRCLKCEKEKKG
jgi:hypothetical protein